MNNIAWGAELRPCMPEFDASLLRRSDPVSNATAAILTSPPAMALARAWPVMPRLKGVRVIARFDDAQEALSRPDIFGVPWAGKMGEQAPSPLPFVLATDDPEEHRRGLKVIMKAFRREDVPRVAGIAARAAGHIVSDAGRELDAVEGLITRVPLEVYKHYYGLPVPGHEFALWLMAISEYTFRQPGPDPELRDLALAAVGCVSEVVDEAIAGARAGRHGDTIVRRFVEMAAHSADLPSDVMRTMLIGMIAGNVPVATAAGGHILEILLKRPAAMRAARGAALDGDDDRFTRCLLEALRFHPINPGLWRVCRADYTLAAGTRRATDFKRGDVALVFLQSAMRDGRRVPKPWRFDPDRPPSVSMVLGYGMHWCVGAPIAVAQLRETFKPLLRHGVRRAPGKAGRTRTFGAFPEHLTVLLGAR